MASTGLGSGGTPPATQLSGAISRLPLNDMQKSSVQAVLEVHCKTLNDALNLRPNFFSELPNELATLVVRTCQDYANFARDLVPSPVQVAPALPVPSAQAAPSMTPIVNFPSSFTPHVPGNSAPVQAAVTAPAELQVQVEVCAPAGERVTGLLVSRLFYPTTSLLRLMFLRPCL